MSVSDTLSSSRPPALRPSGAQSSSSVSVDSHITLSNKRAKSQQSSCQQSSQSPDSRHTTHTPHSPLSHRPDDCPADSPATLSSQPETPTVDAEPDSEEVLAEKRALADPLPVSQTLLGSQTRADKQFAGDFNGLS